MRRYVRSRAFREGFAGGFTTMFTFISPHKRRATCGRSDTVADAWRDVGALINEAYEAEGKRLGKATHSAEKLVS